MERIGCPIYTGAAAGKGTRVRLKGSSSGHLWVDEFMQELRMRARVKSKRSSNNLLTGVQKLFILGR
eukprot:1159156-Pelagomonas_calceolata.AAC.18